MIDLVSEVGHSRWLRDLKRAKRRTKLVGFPTINLRFIIMHDPFNTKLVYAVSHMSEAFRNAALGVSRASGGPSRCAPRLANGSEVDETDVQHPQIDVDRGRLSFFVR